MVATEAAMVAETVAAEKVGALEVAARVLVVSMEAGVKVMEEPGEVAQAVAALAVAAMVEAAVPVAEAVGRGALRAV